MRIIIILISSITLYAYSSKNKIEVEKEGEIPKYIQVDENLQDAMVSDTLLFGKRPLCFKK